jgi:hypothetical protein
MDTVDLQAKLDALNAASPADMDLPHYIGQARHGCKRHRFSGPDHSLAVSSPLEVREVYWPSEDGVHALIFKEGQCRRCGFTGRSMVGRLVLMAERPPLTGRVAR